MNEVKLEESVDDYRLLIVPEQHGIGVKVVEKLREYVEQGGTLIASYPFGNCFDPVLKNAVESLFGIAFKGNDAGEFAFIRFTESVRRGIENMRRKRASWCEFPEITPIQTRRGVLEDNLFPGVAARGYNGIFELREAESLADLHLVQRNWKKNYPWAEPTILNTFKTGPAATINRKGKGAAIFITAPLFSTHNAYYDPLIADFLESLADMTAEPPAVELEAPPGISLSVRRWGEYTDIHLVNITSEKNPVTEYIGNIPGITVKVRMEKDPVSVVGIPGGRVIDFRREGKEIRVLLEDLHIHECIRIRTECRNN